MLEVQGLAGFLLWR